MEQKEYLNEERYQNTNRKIRKIAKIILIVGLSLGLLLILIGIIKTATARSHFESMGSTIFFVLGFMAMFIGCSWAGIVYLITKRREITAYAAQAARPIVQEGIEKMAPTFGKAAETIAKGAKKGWSETEK